jgi:hypothetical protein
LFIDNGGNDQYIATYLARSSGFAHMQMLPSIVAMDGND